MPGMQTKVLGSCFVVLNGMKMDQPFHESWMDNLKQNDQFKERIQSIYI